MRGRYVVLVMLIVAVWWMHRRTPDAEAVAPTTPVATKPEARNVIAPTARPELPADPPPALVVDKPLPEAPSHSVHGRVTDMRGQLLVGVTVYAISMSDGKGNETVGFTREDGYYSITDMAAGTYTLIYQFADHTAIVRDVVVDDHQPTESYASIDLDEPPEPPVTVDLHEDFEDGFDSGDEHPQLVLPTKALGARYNDPEIDFN